VSSGRIVVSEMTGLAASSLRVRRNRLVMATRAWAMVSPATRTDP